MIWNHIERPIKTITNKISNLSYILVQSASFVRQKSMEIHELEALI